MRLSWCLKVGADKPVLEMMRSKPSQALLISAADWHQHESGRHYLSIFSKGAVNRAMPAVSGRSIRLVRAPSPNGGSARDSGQSSL